MYNPERLITALLVTGLLSACAVPGGVPVAAPAAEIPAQAGSAAQHIHPYRANQSLSGRLHISYLDRDRPTSLPGQFEWTQTAGALALRFANPLGQTLAALETDSGGARLFSPELGERRAETLDILVRDTLGWPLPLAQLQYWIQGYHLDAQGLPHAFARLDEAEYDVQGWHLRYLDSRTDAQGQLWPRRLTLTRSDATYGDITVRLIIVDSHD